MAEKAKVRTGQTRPAKTGATSKVSKGDKVVCDVCGLSVVVKEVGGIAVREETTLFCCGKAMKAGKPKAARPVKAGGKTVSGWPVVQVAGSSGPAADPKDDVNQQ